MEMRERAHLPRYAWLSIGAALATLILKTAAYWITDSVGLLSDALESLVNLAAGFLVLAALKISIQPPDDNHPYGHEKVEYFSSGGEAVLILMTAIGIGVMAVERLMSPRTIHQLDLGLGLTAVAALLNLIVSRVLLRASRRTRSVTLRAEAQHLMTDFWTSGGVLAGIGLVGWTGWQILDPVVALAVAGHIVSIGARLVYQSLQGLMDLSLPGSEVEQVVAILNGFRGRGVRYHALRTRGAGARRFVSLHIQVPGDWSVQRGHDLLEEIEEKLREELAPVSVMTHLEPVEDPVSWKDEALDRVE